MIESQIVSDTLSAECNREPIHIPGGIQPHGVLLAARADDLSVVQMAGDTRSLLGIDPRNVRGESLLALLGEEALTRTAGLLTNPQPTHRPGFAFQLRTNAGTLDVAAHTSGGLLVLELERSRSPAASEAVDAVHEMAARIGNADRVQELLERIAAEVQRATGFDRVMVYRFDESGDGHVAAEQRRDDAIESLLGLHYPASDIPLQARLLYLRNWIRCIPDARYSPAPIVPETNPETGLPLDLTFSTLRSVSPIHLQYLANMGVRASMSLSLVVHGRLWGLIACHHGEPHWPSCSLRSGLELFAQLASLQLTTCLDLEYAQRAAARRDILQRIVESDAAARAFPASLLGRLDELAKLVSAHGVIVHANGETACAGCVPTAPAIARLLAWLDGQPYVGLWHTDRLAEQAPIGGDDIAAACGLLAIAIPNASRGYVLWFRPELVTTVNWAGDPRKAVIQGANRLSPRASFAAWRETTRGRSQAWSTEEIEAANRLRTELLEMELLRLQALDTRRELIRKRQDLLMAELDHRVKNVLATIQSVVRFSGKSAESLADFVKALELRLVSMARAHDLLTSSRWIGASLHQLVRDELAAFRPAQTDGVSVEGEDFLLKPSAALALSLVFHELATNAAKYGALSTPQGSVVVACDRVAGETPASVRVEWREFNGPVVVEPARRGFGRTLLEKIFDDESSGARVALCFEPAGVRCTITLAAGRLLVGKAPAATRPADGTAPRTAFGLNGIRILVVEDNPIVALDLADTIRAAAGHVVGPFQALAESAAAAVQDQFDVALLDIDINGEAVWPLAAIVQSRKIPIVFATGFSDVDHWPDEFRNSRTVRKPYDHELLLHELRCSARRMAQA